MYECLVKPPPQYSITSTKNAEEYWFAKGYWSLLEDDEEIAVGPLDTMTQFLAVLEAAKKGGANVLTKSR